MCDEELKLMPPIKYMTDLRNSDEIDTAISAAESEYAENGVLMDAHEALSSLRRKHFE